MKPAVCVLTTDGVNCNHETAYAFELAGGRPEQVHVNKLRSQPTLLENYQILALPGGFSYGDDVGSGRILAVELIAWLGQSLQAFVTRGGLIIGICNGFQVLVKTGLLPRTVLGHQEATLTDNDVGHFRCDWVELRIEPSPCLFTQDLTGRVITLPVAHGEGKFIASDQTVQGIEDDHLVVIRYSSQAEPIMEYPANPNGSVNAIAGVCDPTGQILGLMPHPERFVCPTQYVNWRRNPDITPDGLLIFEQAIQCLS